MNREYPPLSAEDRAALQAFADEKGRNWKSELGDVYWYNARIWEQWTGKTCSKENGYRLHSIRNNYGPTWLYDVCDVKPATKWEIAARAAGWIQAPAHVIRPGTWWRERNASEEVRPPIQETARAACEFDGIKPKQGKK